MHIEQYVQKTYKHGQDIAELLRELQKKDLTAEMQRRQMSTYTAEAEKRVRKIEQEGYDILYTAEVQNYGQEKYLRDQPWKSMMRRDRSRQKDDKDETTKTSETSWAQSENIERY